MKIKVMLINAFVLEGQTSYQNQQFYFPLGLMYLASVLNRNNIDVLLLDFNNQVAKKNSQDIKIESEISQYIKQYKPDIVGIGCMFSGFFKGLRIIAQKIKRISPDLPIVIGGIHPTMFAQDILRKYSYIDYVILGEGEAVFMELINCLIGKKQSLDSIDGIAYRRNGEILKNPKTKFIVDIDTLPFVDFKIINTEDYRFDTSGWYSPKKIKIGQPFSIISSRSCPNCCSFCNMWLVHGPRIRYRSAKRLVDEMEHLYNEYNVRYFHFMDDNLTYDKQRTLEICNGIQKRNLNIQFDTPNGVAVNRLDQEVIDALVCAGLVRISLGIESGSDYIRNEIMGKNLTKEKICEVVRACARHKHLFIQTFFIIGVPQETYATLKDTYDLMKELPFDSWGVAFLTPYPGTRLFEYCIKNNLISFQEDCLGNDWLHGNSPEPHIKPYNLTKADLVNFRNKCCELLKEKRKVSNFPDNYPLRY